MAARDGLRAVLVVLMALGALADAQVQEAPAYPPAMGEAAMMDPALDVAAAVVGAETMAGVVVQADPTEAMADGEEGAAAAGGPPGVPLHWHADPMDPMEITAEQEETRNPGTTRQSSSVAVVSEDETSVFDRCYTYTATPTTSYEYADLDTPVTVAAPGGGAMDEGVEHLVRSELLVLETVDVKTVRVRVNVNHDRAGAFKLVLGAKSKRSVGAYREVVLAMRRQGKKGQDFNDVLFTDDAEAIRDEEVDADDDDGYGLVFSPRAGRAEAIAGGGVFAPEEPLAILAADEVDSESTSAPSVHAGMGGSQGVWALQMMEEAGPKQTDAQILSWELTLCGPPLDEGEVQAADAERCGVLCRLTRPIARLFGRTQ